MMHTWSTVLFDLDGTLTDPQIGITKSAAHALSYYGIAVKELSDLNCFIGPPLLDSFMSRYGFSEEQAREAIEKYREYFSVRGWTENTVYSGIPELLSALVAQGKRLVLATSKPEVYAVRILEHFDLAKYFSVVCGAPLHPPRGHGKADVIRDAIRRAGIDDLSAAVMVGDRHHDVEGAHETGLRAVGVLFGYGTREEHVACGAEYIAADVSELQEILLK